MTVEAFIERWTKSADGTPRDGGAERANYAMFLTELCSLLGVAQPEPAGRDSADYVFERAVRPRDSEGATAPKRIDLYKRDCFILEAKQSRLPGKKNAIEGQLSLLSAEPEQRGRRGVARGWDVMMQNARKQAEQYVFLLDASHAAPPFLIVSDVGHCFEIYADFTGTGRAYTHFPDRQGFRVYLDDLRDEAVRTRLVAIWTEPRSLDPARESARVTREIAKRLAAVSKALEAKHPAEEVAHFLMRCIFTMFAEDVDLLPKGEFTKLLADCIDRPDAFAPLLTELWAKMDQPEHAQRFFSAFRTHLRHFNGNLFKAAKAFPLGREEIGELLAASRAEWTEVDPAIFGTLLEQALDKAERKKLGAHYTPRAYVQRLVEATVMEPLRADWQAALTKAQAAREDGDDKAAIAHARAFHHGLCATRVLDPACGTGNFLYVSLELMKKLEGEVLETLAELGEPESMGLDRETVDPHQFLGLELNPRAAAIAELVVWIGYLQQHYRTRTGHPSEPILRAFKNINFGRREGYDAVLTWDGYPLPTVVEKDGKRVETYPNARRPVWPEAEFIVGNPPFIGKGEPMRMALGQPYLSTLSIAHPKMSESADFVMYWWDRSAEILQAKKSALRQFGLVTTNTLTQMFNRRVSERYLKNSKPIYLSMAIPDHPWMKSAKDSAAVRIAMTVAQKENKIGTIYEIVSENFTDTDSPNLILISHKGRINSNLTFGLDINKAKGMQSNHRIASNGVLLAGHGFLVKDKDLPQLGLSKRVNLTDHIKRYINGRELVYGNAERFILDFSENDPMYIRAQFPEVYQYLVEAVKLPREVVAQSKKTPDALEYARNWWKFAKTRASLREALLPLTRFIGTTETTKHRIFQFISTNYLPDHMIVAIASDQADYLSVLSSRIHVLWSLASGGWLGVGNDPRYSKSRCFDTFPFPDLEKGMQSKLAAAGEEIDATRKVTQSEYPDVSLTRLYNVLEKIRVGTPLDAKDDDIKQRGRVLILKELHDTIDRLTFDAYGWPHDLSDEQILERLVALNAERAREEAQGHVRWLRPDYQIPRFAKGAAAKTQELDLGETVVAIDKGLPDFPADRDEQPLAVEAVLLGAGRAMDIAELARAFKKGGKRLEPRITRSLTTLTRYGRVSLVEGRYSARRAA